MKGKNNQKQIPLENQKIINTSISNYLKAYKKFITKDIYITDKMYTIFINKYKYLYPYINKNNQKYPLLKKIVTDKKQILEKHNKQFINNKIKLYEPYFKKIDPDNYLNIEQKKYIISEEDTLTITVLKEQEKINIITKKIQYLIEKCHYKQNQIAIITNQKEIYIKLKEIINKNLHLDEIKIFTQDKIKEQEKDYEIKQIKKVIFQHQKQLKKLEEEFKKNNYNNVFKTNNIIDQIKVLEKFYNKSIQKQKNFEEINFKEIINKIKKIKENKEKYKYLIIDDYKIIKKTNIKIPTNAKTFIIKSNY